MRGYRELDVNAAKPPMNKPAICEERKTYKLIRRSSMPAKTLWNCQRAKRHNKLRRLEFGGSKPEPHGQTTGDKNNGLLQIA